MNLIKTIPWGVIFGSLSMQLILLFIASFFANKSILYFNLLSTTFIFYIIISIIIKINIIYRLLYNKIAVIAYLIFTFFIIFGIYLNKIGFIPFTLISLIIILIYKTVITILKNNENTKGTTKNASWRNRLRKYEESN